MRKSKYLILSSFFFKFNNKLTMITEAKSSINMINIIDLLRFVNISLIDGYKNDNANINFIYLPDNIFKIQDVSLCNNNIRYLNLSNCKNMQYIKSVFIYVNNIKYLNLSNSNSLKCITDFCIRNNELRLLKFPDMLENLNIICDKNKIRYLDISNCKKITKYILALFSNNKITSLKLPSDIYYLKAESFNKNLLKILNLTIYNNLKDIGSACFSNNPLEEIKILNDITIDYATYYKNDLWNKFVKFYMETGQRAGDYKYEDDEWIWYPL